MIKIVNVFLKFLFLGATVNYFSKNTTYVINIYPFSGKKKSFFYDFL